MEALLIHNCTLIDCTGRDPVTRAWVLLEAGNIARVGTGAAPRARDAVEIDAAGRTLMPGLIDAHAHLSIVGDHSDPRRIPAPVYALEVAREIEQTLADGFTTVRDAGGLDWGYKEALRRGLIRGPRLFISNGPLSQTGGHGDQRPRTQLNADEQVPGVWWIGLVVDGPDQLRWAAREMLRRGADQVKVMANGGCMSPTDELRSTQYTVAELRAAVEEAAAQGKYVMAHTYTAASMMNCLDAGVRTLEHGNFGDAAVAERMASTGTFLVPTITTYEMLAADGRKLHYADSMIDKIEDALKGAYQALKTAYEAGVKIGSGSDVLGFHQRKKSMEPQFKARVMTPMEALIATTRTNAAIVGAEDRIGTVEEGKLADLLLIDGNPLDDLAILSERDRVHLVILGGEIVADRRPQ
ncbi:MAG: amidohydrolase family protein [Candidatus Binataceae bacterium]